MSAPTILCSWCDVEAIYADGRVVAQKDDERQYACENHKRDLLASIESDLWHSGNPFAGEAAEAWIKDMAKTIQTKLPSRSTTSSKAAHVWW